MVAKPSRASGAPRTTPGSPFPLGATVKEKGINFSLLSEHATEVTLVLFAKGAREPFAECSCHRSEEYWHLFVDGLPPDIEYGYHVDGPVDRERGLLFDKTRLLIDPYARSLNTSVHWSHLKPSEALEFRGRVLPHVEFDWQGDRPLNLPMESLIIYEMHVRGFTVHPSSHVTKPGTYLGIIEKIPFLKDLGITAVELMPVYEFFEWENYWRNPKTMRHLPNYWGYSTVNFFTPMPRYATDSSTAAAEFKLMVRELHKAGIEVILDVVFNHTSEGGMQAPALSLRGIDNPLYYMVQNGHYLDYTGCGHTVNANDPTVSRFILDALHYWVEEMHVDGFRFDLASAMTRATNGEPLAKPPLMSAMVRDRVLSRTKLIAEPWDCGGLYQVGSFPAEKRWAEWNGWYRDTVRRFMKGSDGEAGNFAGALGGCQHLYGKDGRLPIHSINFVTAHDGFVLRDLVSYNGKHNDLNGEENRDGNNSNDSWNCGEEGLTKSASILRLRERQMKNFQVALMVSLGTPMILMGDEYGHTRSGNNNTYCQDNDLNWQLWDEVRKNHDFYRFYKGMVHLRRSHPLLRRRNFLTPQDVDWHGIHPFKADWSPASRFVAYTLKDRVGGSALYIAFNSHFHKARPELPPPPPGRHWYSLVNTAVPAPYDLVEHPKSLPPINGKIEMLPHSAIILEAL